MRAGPQKLEAFCPSAVKSRAFVCRPCMRIRNAALRKKTSADPGKEWRRKLRQSVYAAYENRSVAKSISSMVSVTDADVLLSLFGHRSALSGRTRGLTFTQWDPDRPWSVSNCIPLTKREMREHQAGGGLGTYHPAFVDHVNGILQRIPVDPESHQINRDALLPGWRRDIVRDIRGGVPFPPRYEAGKTTNQAWAQLHEGWCRAHFEGCACIAPFKASHDASKATLRTPGL